MRLSIGLPFCTCTLLLVSLSSLSAVADGPADNNPATVRAVPPVGIEVPPQTLQKLIERCAEIDAQLLEIKNLDWQSQDLIGVFPRAVRMTIATKMFYKEQAFEHADRLLDEAERRLQLARNGTAGPELLGIHAASDQPQLLSAGFRSELDGSIQPCGFVLPTDWHSVKDEPMRLDVWLHGRGETVSEVEFLRQRMSNVGEYSPPGTIVLHPYGRYCNAFKFAGEIDILEAIDCAKRLFNIDASRITIRGFSMGGAGCWQMAVHYPNLFAAANPGAGFSETSQFLKVFQQEEFVPTDDQRALLHWYDCPDWVNNLRNVPTVAYSGAVDKQKQAADVMEAAFEAQGMELKHIIGPETAHKILPASKPEIEAFLANALVSGKPDVPTEIDLTTYLLRYHELAWLSIEGLEQHWREARVQGRLLSDGIALTTQNVTRLKLNFDQGSPFAKQSSVRIRIDEFETRSRLDQPLTYVRTASSNWKLLADDSDTGLRKKPGLQGPIDDAFMSPFVFVPPDNLGDSNSKYWPSVEYLHATEEWKRHFRGDIVQLNSASISEEVIRKHNLILFGTPDTNSFIARIAASLPIMWTEDSVVVGEQKFNAATHFPVLIYPNPLNPARYVVINSGFTYREYAYLNNARQIAMLPDWAIIESTDGATTQYPGIVRQSGFFDEAWQLKSAIPE
ncbi:MAG: prolyl oligopeptidase family serine peptidase [Pirellulaceae bacterium]